MACKGSKAHSLRTVASEVLRQHEQSGASRTDGTWKRLRPLTICTEDDLATTAEEVVTSPFFNRRWDGSKTIARYGSTGGFEGASLYSIGTQEAIGSMSQTVFGLDSKHFLRWQASRSLGELGKSAGHQSAAILAHVLLRRKPGQQGSEDFVRSRIATSIGSLGEASFGDGAKALAQALGKEPTAMVRRNAATSLGQLGEFSGEADIKTLVKALRADVDVIVRIRCAEALGDFGPTRIGEAGVSALVEALEKETDSVARLRIATALGQMQHALAGGGINALKKAALEDESMAVRNEARKSADVAGQACAEVLQKVAAATHPFVKGRCAKVLGELADSVSAGAVEILGVTLFNDHDKHVRRRCVEALAGLRGSCGDLGIASLYRASLQNSDVYVQHIASEALQALNAKPNPNSLPVLEKLLADDSACRPSPELTAAELRLIAKNQALALAVEQAATAAAAAAAEAQRQKAIRTLQSVGRRFLAQLLVNKVAEDEAKAETSAPEDDPELIAECITAEEAALADSGSLGRITCIIDFDDESALEVFKSNNTYGEISSDRATMYNCLRAVGHQAIDDSILDAIISETLCGRSFLDEEDFLNFVNEYERRRKAMLEGWFQKADTDGSGFIDADEMAALLKSSGVTAGTGTIPSLIYEVCGEFQEEVGFNTFVQIRTILTERSGFTRAQYGRLRGIMQKVGDAKTGRLNCFQLRGALGRQGFEISLDLVEKWMQAVTEARLALGAEDDNDASSVNEVEYLKVCRRAREAETEKVVMVTDGGDDEAAEGVENTIAPEDLPDLLIEIGNAPAPPEAVSQFMRTCGYFPDRLLTVEDLLPLLELIRGVEGFLPQEVADIAAVFAKYDEDNSQTMSGLELEKACRSLGFPTSFEEVQCVLDDLDMDNSGELDESEFLQAVGKYRKQEIDACSRCIARLCEEGDPTVQTDEEGVRRIPARHLDSILKDLGYEPLLKKSKVRRLAAAAGSVAAAEARDRNEWEGPKPEVDIWCLASLVGEYRAEVREDLHEHHGFTSSEARELRGVFEKFDTDGTGFFSRNSLQKLLAHVFKGKRETRAQQERIRKIVETIDEDGSGDIDFGEFLSLMRIVKNDVSREKQEKERRAVEDTKFSRSELKEFREVFHTFDADGSGDMDFGELQQMVALLIGDGCFGDQGSKELQQFVKEAVKDGAGMIDFSEFLRILRSLVQANWRGFEVRFERMRSGLESKD